VSSAAALGGDFGLQATIDDNHAIYVVDDTPSAELAYRARFYFDPNGISMKSGNAHIIFLARDASAAQAFRIEFRSFQGDYQIRAVSLLDQTPNYTTPWNTVADAAHFIEVDWAAAATPTSTDGRLYLSIDGVLVAGEDGMDNDTRRVDSVRLGAASGIDAGTRGTYFFDAFASTQGISIGPDPSIVQPTPTPPPDAIFSDGFESGDFAAWSAVKGSGDLSVTSAAALDGTRGLEAVINDTAPLYVTDWSPFSEREYHARFVFDPNGLTMLDGRSHFIFQALQGSAKVVARVEVRYKSGNYETRAGLLADLGGWANTSWWPIDDDPQVIEIRWKASDDATQNGALTLWINDVEVEHLGGIDNRNQQIDLARLGVVAGVDGGTFGSTYFDAFESRRQSHIGPPAGP
jgi:hypothetical protein